MATIARQCLPALLLVCCSGAFAADNRTLAPGVHVAINPLDIPARENLARIKLPEGFRISLFADRVPGARSMALSPSGTLFVGTRADRDFKPLATVYAITDPDGDGRADEVITIADDLNVPNGLAFRDGSLYVAELHRIIRYDNIEANLAAPPEPVVIYEGFPAEFHHGWKYLRFGPDGRLYVSVGAPCNTCEPAAEQGIIASLNPDGSDLQTWARGIRNSVGFDWHPGTGELWFTDNGRDLWGDDKPPEELNRAPRPGIHFGFPYRYGSDLVDADYPTESPDNTFTSPALELPAHTAALGMRFYTGEQFPEGYSNQLFIAAHGSWNRKVPDGYSVFMVTLEGNRAVSYREFASGWLTEDKQFWGRPVDIEQGNDGALLVSDDFAGAIYRISYQP